MYEVIVPRSVSKQIRRLHPEIRERVLRRLAELSDEPRPPDCRKLVAEENLYRLRIGTYRAIYSIDDENKRVIINRVAHRREVYR